MKGYFWLKKQYASGARKPPEICDCCGQTKGVIQAHSEDYSEPYGDHIGAYGLCYRCHMILHCRFSSRDAFNAYTARIRSGYRYAPLYTLNWPQFRNDHLVSRGVGVPLEKFSNTPISLCLLDLIDNENYLP